MSIQKKTWAKYLPLIAFVVLFSLLAWLIFTLIGWLDSQEPNKKKTIQQITFITPPPPPPPPPKIEEPPPEVEEVEIEEPEPTPEDLPDLPQDEAPPSEQLGLDADGTGGGDAFGLVGRKGGRGLLSGGDPYALYSSSVQQKLIEKLNESHEIRRSEYSIEVYFWIVQDGSVGSFKLVKKSGNKQLDGKIERALKDIKKFDPPVPGMPQPLKVKLTARL